MEKRWKINPPNPTLASELSEALGISGHLAQLLINRNVESVQEAKGFLKGSIRDLHDPFLCKDMKKAVARIKEAITRGEKIMIWGDYDIDGITSVALLIKVFKSLGVNVTHYIPNRLEEGYGLNKRGAQLAKERGISLLVTVDCGITADKEITYLTSHQIDTIVTDHHQPREDSLPAAFAIINPLQKECPYPFKYLSGVGLASKLASALLSDQEEVMRLYLDLITLGTVGDIVPLIGENRILVKEGLKTFRATRNLGLKALLESTGLRGKDITTRHIGYILGPRINASGRLGSPEHSLELLLAGTKEEASALAKKLSDGNRKRQKIEGQTLQEALVQVERTINFKEHNVIVVGAPNWHQGVIGIVASRLVERYFRPAIMLSFEDGLGRGSGRSIGDFHLFEALSKCEDIVEDYGGHKRACGVKVKKERFDEFFDRINRVAKEMFTPDDFIPSLDIDLHIPLADVSAKLIDELRLLEPFGSENSQPIFCSTKVSVRSKSSIVASKHIKFWVTDGTLTYEAIGFNKAGVFPQFQGGEVVDLTYSPSVNTWGGTNSLQLKIEDLTLRSS